MRDSCSLGGIGACLSNGNFITPVGSIDECNLDAGEQSRKYGISIRSRQVTLEKLYMLETG